MSRASVYVVDSFVDLTREDGALPQWAISTARNSQATTNSAAPGDIANLQDFEELASGAAAINLGPVGPLETLALAAVVDIIDAAHQLEQAAGNVAAVGEVVEDAEAAENAAMVAEAAPESSDDSCDEASQGSLIVNFVDVEQAASTAELRLLDVYDVFAQYFSENRCSSRLQQHRQKRAATLSLSR